MAEVLEERLSDQGFDALSAAERLQDLLAVQNTYLSTFQSLGVLGLLLGTLGWPRSRPATSWNVARIGLAAGRRVPPRAVGCSS